MQHNHEHAGGEDNIPDWGTQFSLITTTHEAKTL